MNQKEAAHIEPTGVIFAIEYQGRFLLEQRDDGCSVHPWSWVIPGGKQEDNEDLLQTAARELSEEFNIEIAEGSLTYIGDVTGHHDDIRSSLYHTRALSLPKPFIINESGGAGWFTLEEIARLELGFKQTKNTIPLLTLYLNTSN